jgi:hypothetical protein
MHQKADPYPGITIIDLRFSCLLKESRSELRLLGTRCKINASPSPSGIGEIFGLRFAFPPMWRKAVNASNECRYRQGFAGTSFCCQCQKKGGCMNKSLKNNPFMGVLMFLSTIALSCVMAQAQTSTLSIKAKIPFAFAAGSSQFPAGTYIFVPTKGVKPTLDVQSHKGKIDETIPAETVKQNTGKPMKPQLVFDQVGNKDFLRQVWIEQKDYSIEKSSNETSMEKQGLKSESRRVEGRYVQGQASKSAAIVVS